MNRKYWIPEPIFARQRVFCLASGPSMSGEVAGAVKGHPAIVVNSTMHTAPWADVLYWTDHSWFEPRISLVNVWRGMAITSNRRSAAALPDKVRLIKMARSNRFRLSDGVVREGRTSGHAAICLAIAMGAREVVLLGYDMRVDENGREHHHNDYDGKRNLDLYAKSYLPAFNGWDEQAKGVGVRIINATPGSAIMEFERSTLDQVLAQ